MLIKNIKIKHNSLLKLIRSANFIVQGDFWAYKKLIYDTLFGSSGSPTGPLGAPIVQRFRPGAALRPVPNVSNDGNH
jgi:hypothetical protein